MSTHIAECSVPEAAARWSAVDPVDVTLSISAPAVRRAHTAAAESAAAALQR